MAQKLPDICCKIAVDLCSTLVLYRRKVDVQCNGEETKKSSHAAILYRISLSHYLDSLSDSVCSTHLDFGEIPCRYPFSSFPSILFPLEVSLFLTPLVSDPSPVFLPLFSLPLRSRPPLRLGVPVAAKRILVHFRHKFAPF